MNEQKLKRIEDYVEEHDNVSMTALCNEFNISMSTLRRAVTVLCERGTINKSYGCVYTTSKRKFMPFHLRASLNTEAKKEACRYAAQLIQENDIIYLDSGSTTCYILDYVSHLKNITVITGNIDIIIKALALDNVTVFVLPGLLNKKEQFLHPHQRQGGLRALQHHQGVYRGLRHVPCQRLLPQRSHGAGDQAGRHPEIGNHLLCAGRLQVRAHLPYLPGTGHAG